MKKPTLLQSGNVEKKQKELLEKDPKEPKLDPLDAEDFHSLRGKHRIKTVVISFKAKGTKYTLRFEEQENTNGSLMMLLKIPLSEIEENTREIVKRMEDRYKISAKSMVIPTDLTGEEELRLWIFDTLHIKYDIDFVIDEIEDEYAKQYQEVKLHPDTFQIEVFMT